MNAHDVDRYDTDRLFDLFIAIVRRAQLDLQLPATARPGNAHPTRKDQESAAEFLAALRKTALVQAGKSPYDNT